MKIQVDQSDLDNKHTIVAFFRGDVKYIVAPGVVTLYLTDDEADLLKFKIETTQMDRDFVKNGAPE
jgi:hypothetical protein